MSSDDMGPNDGAAAVTIPGVNWDRMFGPVEEPPEFRITGSKSWPWPEHLPLPKRSDGAALEFRVVATLERVSVGRRPSGKWGINLKFDTLEVIEVEE